MATKSPVHLSIGRVRVTKAASPSEAYYIQSIRQQMSAISTRLHRVVQHIDKVTPEATKFGLQAIYDESQKLVPVDTGRLKASAFIETRKTARGAEAFLGYGKAGDPPYAGIVHERMDFYHQPPTQAKFLEEAVFRRIQDFRRRVEGYMKGLFGDAGA